MKDPIHGGLGSRMVCIPRLYCPLHRKIARHFSTRLRELYPVIRPLTCSKASIFESTITQCKSLIVNKTVVDGELSKKKLKDT